MKNQLEEAQLLLSTPLHMTKHASFSWRKHNTFHFSELTKLILHNTIFEYPFTVYRQAFNF